MNANLLLKIMELTSEIPEIEIKYLSKITGLNYSQIMIYLKEQMYYEKEKNEILQNSNLRINLAIFGIINLNLPPSRVINYLTWQEFEKFCLYVLEQHEFRCVRNFRFKKRKSRFEIDILGLHQSYMLCIDAKLWRIRSGKPSALRKAVERQIIRTEALSKVISKYLDQLYLSRVKYVYLIPILITSMNEGIKSHKKVPIIPFYQFNNFIADLHKNIDDLPQFKIDIQKFGIQTKLLF
ncbi:MAG: NERD domain-containing protein [Promethearchaeota archaeon]